MKAALIFAIIGLVGCLCGMIEGICKKNFNKGFINFILVCVDIFVIFLFINKLNKPTEVKYRTIDNVQSVRVDSVFTKTKEGVDTTYNVHYVLHHYVLHPDWGTYAKYDVKHIELDTVFTKTTNGVDTTYVINYSKK